jgi:hypothetical protein
VCKYIKINGVFNCAAADQGIPLYIAFFRVLHALNKNSSFFKAQSIAEIKGEGGTVSALIKKI